MKPMGLKIKMDLDDQPSYLGWLVRVDAHLMNMTGLVASDFPDAPLQKWFGERILPEVAAENILKKAK